MFITYKYIYIKDTNTILNYRLREIVDFLPASNKEQPPTRVTYDKSDRLEPALNTIVPSDTNKPYDMLKIIRKVVDDNNFYELMPAYAKSNTLNTI